MILLRYSYSPANMNIFPNCHYPERAASANDDGKAMQS